MSIITSLFVKELATEVLAKTARKLAKRYEDNATEFDLQEKFTPVVGELVETLGQLFKERQIDDIFKGITEPSEITSNVIDLLIERVKKIQTEAGGGLKVDGVLGKRMRKWLIKDNRCGGVESSLLDLPAGKPLETGDNGYPVMLYYVEEDAQGKHKLPRLTDEPAEGAAFNFLTRAIASWLGYFKLEVNYTFERKNANLIITTDSLPAGSPINFLALTSIGPPRQQQLMMTFDITETWDSVTFQACAAHEFGHAIGIRHAHVQDSSGQLMNGMLNTSVISPRRRDIEEAIKIWGAR